MNKTKMNLKSLLVSFCLFTALSLFAEPPISLEKIEHTISESEIIDRWNTRQENPDRLKAVRFVVLVEILGIDTNTWMDVFLDVHTEYKFSYRPFLAEYDSGEKRYFYITDKGLVLEFWAAPAPPDSGRTNRIDSPAGKKLVIFMAKSD